MAKKARAPWKRSNPRKRAGKKSKHLTSAQKSTAKARARRAGRPYPNLVDNMRMASKAKKKKTAKKPAKKTTKKAAKKRSAKKTGRKTAKKASKKKAAKDPKGGLTAAGRAEFARKDGSHLKPGVTKVVVRDDAAGHAPKRQLGGTVLRPEATSAFGRCAGKADAACAVSPCVGRAGSQDRGRCAAHCCKRRTLAAALPPNQAEGLMPASLPAKPAVDVALSNPCKSWFAARVARRLPRLRSDASSSRHIAPWRPTWPELR